MPVDVKYVRPPKSLRVSSMARYWRSVLGRTAVVRQLRPPSVDRATRLRSTPSTGPSVEKNEMPEREKYTTGSATPTAVMLVSPTTVPLAHVAPPSNE